MSSITFVPLHRYLFLAALSILLFSAGCVPNRLFVAEQESGAADPQPPESEAAYRVFLIGDAGLFPGKDIPSRPEDFPTFDLLKRKLDETGPEGAVVFLGDNVYCCGFPDSTARGRKRAEAILQLQLETVEDFPGRIVFVPGNHDWSPGHPRPRERVWRQEEFIESYLDRGNVFLPDSTAPGPVEVELTDDLTLVALDTQWWINPPNVRRAGAVTTPTIEAGQVMLELEDVVQQNRNKDLLVVGHHPMFSIGRHGGYFSPRVHLFPLTEVVPNLYLPLPGIGSVYPLYRRFIGGRQDLAHVQYAQMRRAFTSIFRQHDHLIYAAGHDHNLQYFRQNNQHYLVSGAGSYPRRVAKGRGARFTYGGVGFMTLQYYGDGSVWMEAWAPERDNPDGRLLYRTELKPPEDVAEPTPTSSTEAEPTTTDSTVTRAVNPAYESGPIKRFFLGTHNRYAWTVPVTAPVFHARRVAGGLTPLQRSGSAQTPALRLAGPNDEQYVLRSIDKDPLRSLPARYRHTFVRDIRQDQTSTMHPFAAFLVADLADALGLYHTNPQLYYVPAASGLGSYSPILADRFALFEERPDEDVSGVASFGYSEEAMSYRTVYRKITGDNDHRIDQRMYAKTRLFDILIADWDRHPDQWRWVSFEPPDREGKIYRPIPRDRDFAFFRLDGLFPWLVKKLVLWEYQGFERDYGSIKGLTENGLPQDRRFLSGLDREDWRTIADSIQTALSDSVIDAAIGEWKRTYDPVRGDEIAEVLKVRRDKLAEAADRFYRLLAKHVDVVGSHKHERFEVERLNDRKTLVRVYKTTKAHEIRREIYRRTVCTSDTEQIRLFGLDGRDQFIVSGKVHRGPKVIAVGGPGSDRFEDRSRVGGLRQKTRFQDVAGDNVLVRSPETSLALVDDPKRNLYDPSPYRYNRTFPVGSIGYNIDDGLIVGGGARFLRHGFQKMPYASLQRLEVTAATKRGALRGRYEGRFSSVVGPLDLTVNSQFWAPNSVRNYYGLGNETPNTAELNRYYEVQFARFGLDASTGYQAPDGLTVTAGPSLEYTDISPHRSRFVRQPQAGVSPETFDDHLFVGLGATFNLRNIDSRTNPLQGFQWRSNAHFYQSFPTAPGRYGHLSGAVTTYVSPRLSPQVTVALRIGGATNIGDFPFYRANTLGGQMNLRGYRSTRYAGRSSFFQNLDLRLGVHSFSSYLGWGTIGLLGFADNGRVWADGESSRVWHQGYGGGLWISMFDRFVLTGTAAFSKENRTFTTRLGFMF